MPADQTVPFPILTPQDLALGVTLLAPVIIVVITGIVVLLIDLIVSTTLLSMGMLQLPPAMISLPFKVLLFVMIDGWNLIVGSIVRRFA